MKQTVTGLWAGCFRTDQKSPCMHIGNSNKLLVMGENVRLCLFMVFYLVLTLPNWQMDTMVAIEYTTWYSVYISIDLTINNFLS